MEKVKNSTKKRRVKVIDQLKREDFIVQEWQTFIRALDQDIAIERLRYLDQKMKFSAWGNSEVLAEWFVLNINCGNREIRPEIEKFISKVGRRKFLLPIYKALVKILKIKFGQKKFLTNQKHIIMQYLEIQSPNFLTIS